MVSEYRRQFCRVTSLLPVFLVGEEKPWIHYPLQTRQRTQLDQHQRGGCCL